MFKFPTNLAPVSHTAASQNTESQTRADITTSGSDFPRFPQEQIRRSEYESRRQNTGSQLRIVQCECVGALHAPYDHDIIEAGMIFKINVADA